MMESTPRFDTESFARAVRLHRWDSKLTIRQYAGTVGVSAATISRIENAYPPNVNTLMALLDWMDRSLSEFIIDEDGV